MRIWIDVSNAPQVHFFKNVYRRLVREGHDVLVTGRRFGALEALLDGSCIPYTLVGEHGGSQKDEKLRASSRRVLGLTDTVSSFVPDVALYKHSVEAPRVSYGLGIPSLCVLDNEHAIAQNKLMLPLSTKVIAPRAIEAPLITRFGVDPGQIRHFEGFCELAHIEDFIPSPHVLDDLGLDPDRPIAVMRPEPVMANYYQGDPSVSIVSPLLERLSDFQCVGIPRTQLQEALFRRDGAIVPSACIDALSLMHYADVVISAGGSMNREGVAMAKPAISTYPQQLLAVTDYMVHEGIKSHSCDAEEIVGIIERLHGNRAYGHHVAERLKRMENPIDVIVQELAALEQ